MYWVLPFFTGSYCFYWVLKGLIGFSWVSLTLIRSRWFRLDCTGFYRVLSEWQSSLVRLALDGHASITGRPFKFFYRTRLAFIEFNRSYLTGTGFFFALIDLHSVRTSLLPATIKFYCAPPGGTGFYRVLLGFTGFYWVLWVFMGFTGFFRFVHISSTFGRRKRPESPPQISKMLCKMPAMLEMLEMLGCLERRRHRPPVSRIIRATRKVPQSRKLAHGKILCKMLGMLWMFGCLERVEHGPPISESSPRRTIEPFSQRLHGSKMLRDAQDAPPPQDARDARTSRPTTNRIVERIADRHQLRMRVQRNDARQDSSQDARDARDARTCWSPPSRILYLSDRGNERTNIR